ncbi:MAG TPA: carboxypeptidase-like regulatory domain-containing protein [Ignavibacteriales bacterium]|nr:carboxypeptidase-like regulatory domain-containing protein [Ignavibacteriales bacterium]
MKNFLFLFLIIGLAGCASNNKVISENDNHLGIIKGSIYIPIHKAPYDAYDKYWIKMTDGIATYKIPIKERRYEKDNIKNGIYELKLMNDSSFVSRMGESEIKNDSVTLVKCFVLYPSYQKFIDTSMYRIVEKPAFKTRGAVEGKVNVADDETLKGLKVFINGEFATVTDTNGYFRVDNITPGIYRIEVHPDGERSLGFDRWEDLIVKNATISIAHFFLSFYPDFTEPVILPYEYPTWRENYRPMEE